MKRRRVKTFSCPHCGEEVRKGARACRSCGSDATTGWSPEADTEAVDLPEPELSAEEYQEFLSREGLGGAPRRRPWALLLLLALGVAAALFLLR